MRFLCLHGIGTNSQIFKTQTAALRYELGDDHTFEFVQGTVSWPMAPELASLSSPSQPHFAYYDPAKTQSYRLALKNLDSYVTTEGPFDGVIGFSQGAGLAAMYLIRRLIEDPECESPFKCAILMSRIGVYDEKKWVESGKLSLLESLPPHRKKIDIPTVAIWGQTDEYSRKESELTESFFGPHRVWSYVHRGGHDVPGPHIPGSVSQTIKLINRAVTSVRLDEQEKKLHNI